MLKITVETDAGTEIVDLQATEQKAFEHIAVSPVDWIRNAIYARIGKAVNAIVAEASDKNPSKIDAAEKLAIVTAADIQSAKERTEALEA